MINIRTPEEIEKIARAGKLTADTLSFLAKNIKPGISTLDIDRMAEKYIRDRGGIPSEKGYYGYPGSICASVNEVVVHGIPSARKILRKGDIISLDLVVVKWLHGRFLYHCSCRTLQQEGGSTFEGYRRVTVCRY